MVCPCIEKAVVSVVKRTQEFDREDEGRKKGKVEDTEVAGSKISRVEGRREKGSMAGFDLGKMETGGEYKRRSGRWKCGVKHM